MKTPKSFVSLGSGNVATHLSRALSAKGFILKQVYSRSEKSSEILASELKSAYTTAIAEIDKDADFYMLAVSDSAMHEVLSELRITDKLIFHTAGMYGLDVFNDRFSRYGIIYPLQTFSKVYPIDISSVPLLIEACNKETESDLIKIAGKISNHVVSMNQERRKWLHLAAIFASNFTNHMYLLAHDILKRENLDFNLLYPLMEETLRKAVSVNPKDAQTGPAVRGDRNTMDYHLKLLANCDDLQKLYTFISKSIWNHHVKE